MGKLKICLLNDSFPPLIDGVANTVKNYADILTEVCGDEVLVATPRYPGGDYSGYPYPVIAYQSLNTARVTAGYRMGNSYSPEALFKIREFRPDIIHAHCPFSSLLLGKHARSLTKAPLIFTYHTKFDYDIARAIKYKLIQKTVVKGLISFIGIADEIWTVSEGAGESLKELGYKGEYKIMNNGVDFPKGPVNDELVKEVTKGYDLPHNVPVFIFVGRMFRYKGLPLIMDTLKNLHEKGIDFRMVFIGDGTDLQYLKDKTAEYDLEHKVLILGKIMDRQILRAWYTRGDLFLFPSVYDTNGIVVREAAACGLASVLIKGSCAAEGISSKVNGYLIDENIESFTNVLEELSSQIPEMRKAGTNAMNQIYVSWKDAVLTARVSYEELLKNRK